MYVALSLLPIVGLIAAMTVRAPRAGLPLPAHFALPAAALLALLLHALAGPDRVSVVLAARVIEGVLTSLIPLGIVFGAVLLFRTLVASGAMAVLTAWLERSVPDTVLRVVLVAWAFSYLVEGLSGFGTPAALAAPVLVGLGFPAVRAAAACLIMNTVPVVFGAVGTPIWFGFGELGFTDEELGSVAMVAALLQCIAAPVVVVLALRLLFPWRDLRARAFPIAVVLVATLGSSAIVATLSTEFPSIAGGIVGLLAAYAVGRRAQAEGSKEVAAREGVKAMPLWRAALPLIATVLLLAITRFEPIGLRALLTAGSPSITADLGPAGMLSVSAALVIQLDDILQAGISWSMPVLYIPFILPFVVVVLVLSPLLGLSARQSSQVWLSSARNLFLPAIALAGALVFVKLMMHGGELAPVVAIGQFLADTVAAVHGPLWLPISPLLGVLGSFFSGSATVSNLTFGPVQHAIATRLGLDPAVVLALQAFGAAMGNMVCVHNIVAVAAVLGLTGKAANEGESQRRLPDQNNPVASPREDPVSEILRLNAKPILVVVTMSAGVATVLGVK